MGWGSLTHDSPSESQGGRVTRVVYLCVVLCGHSTRDGSWVVVGCVGQMDLVGYDRFWNMMHLQWVMLAWWV